MDEGNTRSFQKILKELAESSALHGIPKIASSRQLAVKVMWCILVVSAVGVMTYQLVELFKTFYSNPVQTTVSLDFSTLQYPAITICNMNPVRKSKLAMAPDLFKQLFPKVGKTKSTSTSKRRKRELFSGFKVSTFEVDSDINLISGDTFKKFTEYTISENGSLSDLQSDELFRDVLAQYNVSTKDELMKLLANGSDSTHVHFSFTRLANGSYVYSYSSADLNVADIVGTSVEPAADTVTENTTKELTWDIPIATKDELMKLLPNGSDFTNAHFSFTRLANGSYKYSISSIDPNITDIVGTILEPPAGTLTENPIDELTNAPIATDIYSNFSDNATTINDSFSSTINSTEMYNDSTTLETFTTMYRLKSAETESTIATISITTSTEASDASEDSTIESYDTSEIIPTTTEQIYDTSEIVTTTTEETTTSLETTTVFKETETITEETSEWFDDIYDSFDWDIFYNMETNGTQEYNPVEIPEEHIAKPVANYFSEPRDKWDQIQTDFKTTFRRIDLETRKEIGHQLNEFIQYVSFAKRQQEVATYFQLFTTSTYGNCYTMDNSKFKSWRSGPETGIKLTLNLEIDEYVESFSSGYGVKIVFHEPGTFPMPAEEGLTISPGYETSIGLRAINVTRLGDPYGDCTVEGSEQFQNKYNIKYSKTACLEFCRIENIISRCQCIPIDAPDIDFGVEIPVCGDMDEFCAFEVEFMFEEGTLNCDCINPCSEFVYAKTISGRVWPHREYLEKVLMQDMCQKNIPSLEKPCRQIDSDSQEFDHDRYGNNFVRVHIYFEDLNYQKITEEPFYTTVRFICDIGGAMGLFIGVSILSLFEVLQLLLEVILYLLHKRSKKEKSGELVEVNGEC